MNSFVEGADIAGLNTVSGEIEAIKKMVRKLGTQIGSVGALENGLASSPKIAPSGESVSFASIFKNMVDHTNQTQVEAQRLGDAFAKGSKEMSVSEVLIALRKAEIQLQLTTQSINKMVAAYNEVKNISI